MAELQSVLSTKEEAAREVARTLRREKISRTVRYVILLVVGLMMLYPLAWMFSASFKPNHEIFTTLNLWPSHATWDGFINGWKTGTEYNFGHYMINTFKYVIPKVILTIISSTVVAYGFARFEIPWKKFWFATLIATMLLPSTVLLIPQYLMFREMGMLNSYLPLYLPTAFATQGFFVFMLIQFLRGVPRDMEEAAQIDGCNSWQVLWYVVVPILKPAIISVALFQFMWSMNDFIGPLIYVYSVDKYPIALALKMSIDVTEGAPRGGYTELDLAQTNYLRELVELAPETSSKVAVEKDRRRMKANQIRRAVKRHSQMGNNNNNRRSSSRNNGNG